jgi:hypothetical protein
LNERQVNPDLLEFVWRCEGLIYEYGFGIATRGQSLSGSVYLRITRFWIPKDKGVKVRISDHAPPRGPVPQFFDVRPTPEAFGRLREFLRGRAARGWGSSRGRG